MSGCFVISCSSYSANPHIELYSKSNTLNELYVVATLNPSPVVLLIAFATPGVPINGCWTLGATWSHPNNAEYNACTLFFSHSRLLSSDPIRVWSQAMVSPNLTICHDGNHEHNHIAIIIDISWQYNNGNNGSERDLRESPNGIRSFTQYRSRSRSPSLTWIFYLWLWGATVRHTMKPRLWIAKSK